MSIPGKSKLKKVSLTASRIVGLLVGIVVTGYYANSIWHLFCAHKLGWGDGAPEWYRGIEDIVIYGIFAGSVILWLGGAYWFRLRAKKRTQRYSGITPPCTGSPTAFGFRRPSSPARTLTSILKVSGVILGSALFFPVSCTTALLAGIQINSFLFAHDMSRGDKPQSPFYVLATVPTGNISPIELIEVDTYIEKTPDVSFLLAQPSGTLPGALPDEWFSWRVISSNFNEQLVEVQYFDGDTRFINRYRAMPHSVSPVSSRMWYHGYMFASFPLAIGFGLLVYWLGRYLRRKYVVRISEKVNKWVTTLVIICILGMVAATIPSYVVFRKSLIRQEQVISDFNKALEINPKDAEAYLKRGITQAEKGRYEQAISDLTKALEINPRDAKAYFNRGYAYGREGKYDQAISDFNKALEINPKDAEVYFNRGNAYWKKGQDDQAISDFNKALEINPRDALAYNNRGLVYGRKSQYDQEISDYTKALEINPREADAYINRGLAYAEKGHHEQAILDYTKVLEIDPRYAKVYVLRGFAYYYEREYEKSWKDVEKAQYLGFSIDPKFLDDLRKASGRQN